MKKIILILIVPLCFSFILFSAESHLSAADNAELSLHVIDIGQGDCIFITLPDGINVLVDTGSPAAGPRIVQYLRSQNIRKINHLILTHPHDDHIGGIFSVHSEFAIDYFYDNGFGNFQSTLYGDYIRLIRKNLSKYKILQSGETLIFDNVKMKALNPLLPPTGNPNNDSIVLQLIYGDIRILLAGDVGNLAEQRLINADIDLVSQILKIGHHGDKNASSDAFLERVSPETAIISVSSLNKYAKPHQQLLDRLTEQDIKLFRTDKNGNIVVKTDGKKYHIKRER